jgi:hypothetical protein
MTTDALTGAGLNGSVKPPATTHRHAHALRYENLSRVLLNVPEHVNGPEQADVPAKPKRDRKAGTDRADIAELRAHVAALKAENERTIERIIDELDGLTDRLLELEARARQPFWRRVFGHAADQPELGARARRRLADRLRSIFCDRTDPEQRTRAA